MDNKLTRRSFLKLFGATTAGALAYTSGLGKLLKPAHAQAAGEKSAVVLIFLTGGYNALFCSADSFLGRGSFGVNQQNVQRIGTSDLFVDKSTFGTMPADALQHMASIGVRHGISSHDAARMALWNNGNRSYPIQLAAAMGGDASIKYASVGLVRPFGQNNPEGGVSLQTIRDMRAALDALGGSSDAATPDRAIAASALAGSAAMSQTVRAQNPTGLPSLFEGYGAAVETLRRPVETFNFDTLSAAYDLGGSTAIRSFASQLAAAELMVRTRMRGMMPALNTFLSRTLAMPNMNVVTVIFGDFSRSLPGSNHQPNLTATVIGKYVKLGTTGRVDNDVGLPNGTPGIRPFWAYLAAVAKAPGTPFGENPHRLVLG